jgi:opacity protein-like surface antigen
MSRLCIGVFLLVPAIFFRSSASGQDLPKGEVFGGYSYLHVDTHGITTSALTNECNIVFGGTCPATFGVHPGFNGWNVAAQGNINQWFGVKAQVAAGYGNILSVKFNSPLPIAFGIPGQHIYDVLFGPVISKRSQGYTAFAHGLIGLQHVGLTGNIPVGGISFSGPSETNLAFALGGGLDVKASRHFAVRIGQFDYEFVNTSGSHQNDFRFSAGVVFGFGGKH